MTSYLVVLQFPHDDVPVRLFSGGSTNENRKAATEYAKRRSSWLTKTERDAVGLEDDSRLLRRAQLVSVYSLNRGRIRHRRIAKENS